RQLPSNQLAEAEPHIIRSFTDPNPVIATFQEGRQTGGGALGIGYAVSQDAGVTWTRSYVPQLRATFGGWSLQSCDVLISRGKRETWPFAARLNILFQGHDFALHQFADSVFSEINARHADTQRLRYLARFQAAQDVKIEHLTILQVRG